MARQLSLCVSRAALALRGDATWSVNPDLKLAIRFLPTSADASYMFEFADWGRVEQELGYSGASRPPRMQTNSLATSSSDYLAARREAIRPLTCNPPALATSVDPRRSLGRRGVPDPSRRASRDHRLPRRLCDLEEAKRLAKCGFRSRSVGGMTLYTAIGGAAFNCLSPIGTGIPGRTTTSPSIQPTDSSSSQLRLPP